MTPPELLRETQKAAGNKELSLWHEQLIVKRTEQKTLQSVRRPHHKVTGMDLFRGGKLTLLYNHDQSVRSDTDALATLESRTAVLERDWLRFQEREKILKKVCSRLVYFCILSFTFDAVTCNSNLPWGVNIRL